MSLFAFATLIIACLLILIVHCLCFFQSCGFTLFQQIKIAHGFKNLITLLKLQYKNYIYEFHVHIYG